MKKFSLGLTVLIVSQIGLSGSEVRDAKILFEKKCQMCHATTAPKSKQKKMLMVSPPMNVVAKNMVWGIDSLHDKISDEDLRNESITFMKDYLYNPDRKKSNCEDISFEKFGMMPSLKGFITEQELDVLLPWVYDNFKPTKINGSWIAK
ncbi:MAG: hypothetical protein PHF17_10495 [Arcobacteraceae bacterium]|jgi:hypothetical protein|nr:hypothetical protein [Arcobacteraceae bacterium]